MKMKSSWWMKMLIQNSATAQSLAAAVPRSPELVRALDACAAAKAKQKTLHAEIAELSKRRNSLLITSEIAVVDARLAAIGDELRCVETERLAANRHVEHHQPNYAAAVRAALLQRRREAAARVVASIDQLAKAAAELDETAAAITAAGGHARRIPSFPLIDGLQKIAKTIEAEA